MTPAIPDTVLVAVITLFGTALGAWLLFRKGKGDTKASIDARIDERIAKELKRAYDRIDAVEEKLANRDRAIGNILAALARQWPSGTPRPVLDPDDLATLDDTVPALWRSTP